MSPGRHLSMILCTASAALMLAACATSPTEPDAALAKPTGPPTADHCAMLAGRVWC
jgi:hypothetical protein